MSSSNPPQGGGNMEQPDDSVVEELFLALMEKRGWHQLPLKAVLQMKAYPPSKKWSLVRQDAVAHQMFRASQNKVPSRRVERGNAIKITKPLPPLPAAQPGGSSVVRRKPVANPASRPAPGAGHIPVARGPAGGSMIAPVPRQPLPSPAVLEQELNIEGIQGDVSEDVGPLTQGDAYLRITIADGHRSLAAGEAEVDRRFNPPSNQPPTEKPDSGANVASLHELLQSDTLEDLFRHNAEAREFISTAEGLQEYWTNLREEWRRQQGALGRADERIATLKGWAKQKQDQATFPGQLLAENAKRDEILSWFGEKRVVLRLLVVRYRKLQTAASALARRPERRQPAADPQKADLYTDAQDVGQLDWYRDIDRGAQWWLDHVLTDMQLQLDRHWKFNEDHAEKQADCQRLKNQTDDRIDQRKARYDKAVLDADKEITDAYAVIMQGAANGVDAESKMQRISNDVTNRMNAKLLQMKEKNDGDRALIRSYSLTELYQYHYGRFERDFERRYGTIYNAIRDVYTELVDNGQAPTRQELNDSYKLAWYLYTRGGRIGDLFRLLDKTPERSALAQYLDDYVQQNRWDRDAMQNVLLVNLLPICHDEWEAMMRLISRLREVAPSLDNDDAPAFEDNIPDYSPPPVHSLPHVASSSIWTADRMENHKYILNSPFQESTISGTITTEFTWGYQLRAFFGSPDIWRNFTPGATSYTKTEFFDLVNSLVKYDIPNQVMEAWLDYCTYTKELFRLGKIAGKVTVRETGWETKYENEIGGMARSLDRYSMAKVGQFTQESQVPPEARRTDWRRWRIDVVEDTFKRCTRNGQGFRNDDDKREWPIDWLLEQINWQLEPRERDDPEHTIWELEQYLDNWLVRGVFWMRQDRIKIGGDPRIVVRLDSGWELRNTSAHMRMKWDSREPPFVARVMGEIGIAAGDFNRLHRRLKNTSSRLYDENNLYRHWILRDNTVDTAPPVIRYLFTGKLQPGPAQASIVQEDWGISRGTWHLFLRWLDDYRASNQVLFLTRGGKITPYPRSGSFN